MFIVAGSIPLGGSLERRGDLGGGVDGGGHDRQGGVHHHHCPHRPHYPRHEKLYQQLQAPLEELEAYARLGDRLASSITSDPRSKRSHGGAGGGGEEREVGEGDKNGQRRKKVKFDDGYRSSQDRDGSGMVKEAEGLGQTSEEGQEQKEEAAHRCLIIHFLMC